MAAAVIFAVNVAATIAKCLIPFQGSGTVHAEDPSTATLLGMRTRAYRFQPVSDVKKLTDFDLR